MRIVSLFQWGPDRSLEESVRVPITVSLAVAGGLVLAGCGGSATTATEPTATTATTSTGPTAASSDEPTPRASAQSGSSGQQPGASTSAKPKPGTAKKASPKATAPKTAAPKPAAPAPGRYLGYDEYNAAPTAFAGTDVVLFFHAPWCPQCRSIESDIFAQGVPEGVTIVKVDYDSNQSLRQQYGVTLQTTFVEVDAAGTGLQTHVAYDDPHLNAVIDAML